MKKYHSLIKKILSPLICLALAVSLIAPIEAYGAPLGAAGAVWASSGAVGASSADVKAGIWQDPQVIPRTEPMELLVIVAQFKDYNEFSGDYFKNKFYNEIFATGTIEDGTYTVNDYFKEVSNGQFFYKPIVLNGNTTGVYPLYLDENYTFDNIPEYCYKLFGQLVSQGLNPQNFLQQKDSVQGYFSRKAQVMVYFPHIIPHMGSYFLINENSDAYSAIVCVDYANSVDENQGTPPNTVCHELGHTFGFVDLYLQGSFIGLMNSAYTVSDISYMESWDRYPFGSVQVPPHLDPFYKIAMHWYTPQVIEKASTVRLYPASNPEKYNPVIVKTDNANQYFIIENRQLSGFDMYLNTGHIWAANNGIDTDDMILDVVGKDSNIGEANYKGINIWRIDALSYSDSDWVDENRVGSAARKWNWPINILHKPGEKASPLKYENLKDINKLARISSGVEIEFVSEDEDGSIVARIVPPDADTLTDTNTKPGNAATAATAANKGLPAPAPTPTPVPAPKESVTKVDTPLKTVNIQSGKSFIIPVAIYDGKNEVKTGLTWESDNPKIKVSKAGKVTVPKNLKKGKATVTATAKNGKKFTVLEVNVLNRAVKLDKAKTDVAIKDMKLNAAQKILITLSPKTATLTKITFKSSKASGLYVDKAGNLIAKKKGTYKITITVNNVKFIKTVKVT